MNRSKFGMTGLVTCLAALTLSQASLAVASEPVVVTGSAVPTIRVSYADLNLGSANDRDRLDARVSRAAKQLCIESFRQPLGAMAEGRKCRDAAIAGARPQISAAIERHQFARLNGGGAQAILVRG